MNHKEHEEAAHKKRKEGNFLVSFVKTIVHFVRRTPSEW